MMDTSLPRTRVHIDLDRCYGCLIIQRDHYEIEYQVTLKRIRRMERSNRLYDSGKGISDHTWEYNYPLDQEYRDHRFPDILTWLIRGMHGIPLEVRNEDQR